MNAYFNVNGMAALMEDMFAEDSSNAMPVISFVHEEKEDNYLSVGQRLEDLAREVFHRNQKEFELSSIEQSIFSISIDESDSLYDILSKISKKVVRPMLKSMCEEGDVYHQAILSLVDEKFGITLSIPKKAEISLRYIFNASGTRKIPDEKLLLLTVNENGYAPLEIYGAKNTTHPANRKNSWFHSNVRVADIADVISFLFILSKIYSVFQTESVSEDIYYNKFLQIKRKWRDIDIWELNNAKSLSEHKFLLPADKGGNGRFLTPLMESYLRKQGAVIDVEPSGCIRHEIKVARETGVAAKWPVLASITLCKKMYPKFFMEIKDFDYHDFCDSNETGVWPFFSKTHANNYCYVLVKDLFVSIWEEKTQIAKSISYQAKLNSDYAKSYQTKKNVPEKVVSAMKHSLLNKYFGYVEFDELTDISKMDQIAREIAAVKEAHLSFVDSRNNAIRFRRLGNHHAAGLYFPMLKCLCVDIHNPYSFIHEYGHLIDYEYGKLSHQYAFLHIRNLYKAHLTGDLDPVIKAKLNGNSKYNMNYYLEPTEIFARCFELYMAKYRGVSNSLLPETFGWEYPSDEKFLEAVKFYFDNALANIAMRTTMAA